MGFRQANIFGYAVIPLTDGYHKASIETTQSKSLRSQGSIMQRNIRIGDFAGRWGGDEFVVCLEDFGEAGNAAAAAQKLLLVLSEKYEIGNSEVYATPSIGIAMYPDSGEAADRLERAVEAVLADGLRTADLMGPEGGTPVSTSEMSDAIVAKLAAKAGVPLSASIRAA